MNYELKYDIVYSLLAHESLESLYNLIENIFSNNLNYNIAIIIHFNNYMIDNFNTTIENVFINDIYYDKKLYNHTILKAHSDNFNYFEKKKIKFQYFIPLSSNCMFIKQMNIPSDYKYSNIQYKEDFKINTSSAWHWKKILKNKNIIEIFKKNKIPIRIGFHEGRIIFYNLFKKINDFIIENKIFSNIEEECVFEEFIIPSLEAYFNNNINSNCILKLYKNRLNEKNCITYNKLKNLHKNIFLVKRVPRDLKNNIRIIVNKFTNTFLNKNGHFKCGNNTIFINFSNLYLINNDCGHNNLFTNNLNNNNFTVLNYKSNKSIFSYNNENDIWVENRFLINNKQINKIYIRTKKKKIAILIKGASSLIDDWGVNDFLSCYESLKNNILNDLKKINYDYDIYIHSYDSKDKIKIIKLLKPKKFIFERFTKNSNQISSFKQLLKSVPNNYDSYFVTRFDLIYKKSLNLFNINFEKSYYLFKFPNNKICDIIFIISNNDFINFKKFVNNYPLKNGFHIEKFPFDINPLLNNRYYSDTDYDNIFILNKNPIYKLNRIRRWGFKNEKEAIEQSKLQKKYNKKMAILLYGISYDEKLLHFNKKLYLINYKKSLDNYKNILINYFKNLNYSIDIFICTNDNLLKKDLIKDYAPVDYLFVKDDKNEFNNYNNFKNDMKYPERYYYTNTKKLKVLELTLEYSKKNKIYYDNIILTRFDLNFNIPFNEVSICYGMFNIISMLESNTLVDDNFYLFPGSNLQKVIKIIRDNLNLWGHGLKELLKNNFDINYILNENKNVKYLSFYSIVRNEIN
jgi:hypothetical protein